MAGTVLEEIRRLDDEAAEHKRLAARHRRAAASARAQRARLLAYAAASGIEVVLVPTKSKPVPGQGLAE